MVHNLIIGNVAIPHGKNTCVNSLTLEYQSLRFGFANFAFTSYILGNIFILFVKSARIEDTFLQFIQKNSMEIYNFSLIKLVFTTFNQTSKL